MRFKNEEWTITKLLVIYSDGKLNLNPPYQRNDIWSNPAKRRLIDSIKKGYPLPIFFLHEKSSNNYDMVDGQQRTRAIYGYKEGFYKDLDKISYNESNITDFLDYKIAVTIIFDVEDETLLSDFYYRVNKFGSKLNRPEILKAQFSETKFQDLVTNLADFEDFSSLNLFTPSTLDRMIDLDFVSELLGYIKFNITEKKQGADHLYESDIDKDTAEYLYSSFIEILKIFNNLNGIYPISETRYKQRNDFYTFWGFIWDNISIKMNVLEYFYKILVLIDKQIFPTNEKCLPFSTYAYHCVTQSNSKRARIYRINFFNELLMNTIDKANETQMDILKFYNLNQDDVIKIDKYTTLEGIKLQSKVGLPELF